MKDKTLNVIDENGQPAVITDADVTKAIAILLQIAGVAMSRNKTGTADTVRNGAVAAERAFAELAK